MLLIAAKLSFMLMVIYLSSCCSILNFLYINFVIYNPIDFKPGFRLSKEYVYRLIVSSDIQMIYNLDYHNKILFLVILKNEQLWKAI